MLQTSLGLEIALKSLLGVKKKKKGECVRTNTEINRLFSMEIPSLSQRKA